jgi:hypothetical protein
MLLFIGPEFIAHLLNRNSNVGRSGAMRSYLRARGDALDKPNILLNVRVILIESVEQGIDKEG